MCCQVVRDKSKSVAWRFVASDKKNDALTYYFFISKLAETFLSHALVCCQHKVEQVLPSRYPTLPSFAYDVRGDLFEVALLPKGNVKQSEKVYTKWKPPQNVHDHWSSEDLLRPFQQLALFLILNVGLDTKGGLKYNF